MNAILTATKVSPLVSCSVSTNASGVKTYTALTADEAVSQAVKAHGTLTFPWGYQVIRLDYWYESAEFWLKSAK